jgi:hypothetical protein
VPGDALALTALTGLTRLELQHLGAGVGDLAATAIACSCKQLRHLDLRKCNLQQMTCVAAIAHLTQLTHLQLQGDGNELSAQGLSLLTRLKQLREFELAANDWITVEDIERFWAAVRPR